MNTSEIAKLAHVSRTTVSRVLNGHPNVSEKTRRRVESIVREYHFFPDAAARNLVGKQSKVFGLFIAALSMHFLRFVQSSGEWIAVLRVTRGMHQFSSDFPSKWLEIVSFHFEAFA